MNSVEGFRSSLGRITGVVVVAAIVIGFTGQFLPASVSAAGQISARSITLGSSAASATTTYSLTFTPATNVANPAGVVIDFCSNDPIPGDTCSFSAATVPTISSPTSSVGTAATVGSGSPVHTVKVTGITSGLTAGTPITINFTAGFTNPSTATSFYARVMTYTSTNTSEYVPANTTGGTTTVGADLIDSGGIALSTAANITVNAKVFETLSYCVFQSACGTAPVLTLGDATTGALSTTTAYVNNNAQYTIATNASGGAVVVMRGNTLCRSGTLSNCNTGAASAFTITGIGNAQTQSSVGNEQFGMCVDTTGASGGLAGVAPYNDTSGSNIKCHTGLTTGTYSGSSYFGFNDSTSSGGTNNASGSTIMQSTGAISSYTGTFAFLGNIAATTEAGIYTTSLNTVATGTF